MARIHKKLLGILSVEVVLFVLASFAHRGILVAGYEHGKAAIAESVIAAVLAAGLIVCLVKPIATRTAALWVQCFALLGVCVGLLMIAIGVGPRTGPDLVLHALMLMTLIVGLLTARDADIAS
jgi:hypothetical protein